MPKTKKRGFVWNTFCSCFKRRSEKQLTTDSTILITQRCELNKYTVEKSSANEIPLQIVEQNQLVAEEDDENENNDEKTEEDNENEKIDEKTEEDDQSLRFHDSLASVGLVECSDEKIANGESENENKTSSLAEVREEEAVVLSVRFETEEPVQMQTFAAEEVLDDNTQKLPADVLFQCDQNTCPDANAVNRQAITPELQKTLESLGTAQKEQPLETANDQDEEQLDESTESPDDPPVEVIQDVKKKIEASTTSFDEKPETTSDDQLATSSLKQVSEASIANNEGTEEHITEISQLKGQNLKWKIIIKHHSEQDQLAEPTSQSDLNAEI